MTTIRQAGAYVVDTGHNGGITSTHAPLNHFKKLLAHFRFNHANA
jgi:hypothetical protein